MNLTERAEIRKETFYKLTNSRNVPEVPSGNRNLYALSKNSGTYAYGVSELNQNIETGEISWKTTSVSDSFLGAFTSTIGTTYRNGSGVKIPVLQGKDMLVNLTDDRLIKNYVMFWGDDDTLVKNTIKYTTNRFKIQANQLQGVSYLTLRFGIKENTQKIGTLIKVKVKVEYGSVYTDWSLAPEDFDWSATTLVPTQSKRYLWKFEYVYYSDGSVEVTKPVNLSIAGGTVTHRETFYKLTNSADRPDRPTGTRNLLLYSGDPYAHTNEGHYSGFMASAATESVDGSVAYKTGPNAWARLGIDLGKQLVERRLVKAGDKLTYSVLAKTDQDTPIKITLFVRYKGSGSGETVNGKAHDVILNKNWQKISIPFTVTEKMVAEATRVNYFAFEQTAASESGKYVYYACNKIERGDTATPYNRAPEDYGWTIVPLVPTQSNRYLWKFEYIYYSDGNVEVTDPVNISIAGEDGKNSYIHTAYANITKLCSEPNNFTLQDAGTVRYGAEDRWIYKTLEAGTYTASNTFFGRDPYPSHYKECQLISDFSLTDSTGRDWLGTYSDNSVNAVSHPSYFTWQLTKGQTGPQGIQGLQGPKGDQGIPGAKGADGRTQYTHIAYADNATGGGFSQTDQTKAYIGMYVDFNATDSTDPTKYRWSKWHGDKGATGAQGIQGPKGADGRTPYIHFAYANSADGRTDFSTSNSGNKRYLGTYTDYTQADSTDPTKYKWVDMVGSVEVGGVNLLHNSKGPFKPNKDNPYKHDNYIVYPKVTAYLEEGKQYIVTAKTDGAFSNNHVNVESDNILLWMVKQNGSVNQIISNTKTGGAGTVFVWNHPTGEYCLRVNAYHDEPDKSAWEVKIEEGNVKTTYTRNPDDIQADIDSKADSALTQEQLNALEAKRLQMETEMKALATLQQVSELETFINNLKQEDSGGRQKIIEITKAIEERVKDIEPIMEYSQKLKFMDTYITQGNGGMIIGANDSTTKVVVTPDRISFQSGGSEVAYISQRMLHIDNGVFTMSLQLGHYITRAHPRNEYVNATYFVK